MSKVSMPISNDYCPQTLFLYGTYKEDGTPDFGLFCWFSYYFDGEVGVMACIGGEKLTKERIHAGKVFSANLVTEKLLPLADHFGSVSGHDPAKMSAVHAQIEKGAVLDVPVLTDSPVAFELEVDRFLPMDDGEVLLCRIRNVYVDEELAHGADTLEQKMRRIAPVCTTCGTYFGWDGRLIAPWGSARKLAE